MEKISRVFDANKRRLQTFDEDLKNRYDAIQQLTSQLEMYICMIQHESNNFDILSEESNIKLKNEVMDIVEFISQQQYKDIEDTVVQIKGIYDSLKTNVKNGEVFDQIIKPAENLFD